MKSFVKRVLRFAWRKTHPIRRRVVGKTEAMIVRAVHVAGHGSPDGSRLALDIAALAEGQRAALEAIARLAARLDALAAAEARHEAALAELGVQADTVLRDLYRVELLLEGGSIGSTLADGPADLRVIHSLRDCG